MKKSILASFVLFSFFQSQALVSDATKNFAQRLKATSLAEVKFDANATFLTAEQKKEMADAVTAARQKGDVEKVRVFGWADREYPNAKEKINSADVDLAKSRLSEVEGYLKKELGVSDTTTYNMAERPNTLQKLLNTPAARVKNSAEKTGAAPQPQDDLGFFNQNGQASKVLVMISLKGVN